MREEHIHVPAFANTHRASQGGLEATPLAHVRCFLSQVFVLHSATHHLEVSLHLLPVPRAASTTCSIGGYRVRGAGALSTSHEHTSRSEVGQGHNHLLSRGGGEWQ